MSRVMNFLILLDSQWGRRDTFLIGFSFGALLAFLSGGC